MGCNCGGSTRQARPLPARQTAKAPAKPQPSLDAMRQPGYTWNGPPRPDRTAGK